MLRGQWRILVLVRGGRGDVRRMGRNVGKKRGVPLGGLFQPGKASISNDIGEIHILAHGFHRAIDVEAVAKIKVIITH